MTKEELAAKLNGRERGNEITKEEILQAKENCLVVVFGYSDDGIEFKGSIRVETGCYGGSTIYLSMSGVFEGCDCECSYSEAAKRKCAQIKAVWDDQGEYLWTYETEIPHATFGIFEDGEKFCRGIVFEHNSLPTVI
jgi:hypothetical protein